MNRSLQLRRQLLATVRAECENRPGTYRMLAENDRVIYVGKSRQLRTRLLSYFRAKGRRDKAARIVRHTTRIEWDYAPNEFSALLHELRLIKKYRPHFNRVMVTDEWPRAYIALTSDPVPALRVVRRTDDAGAALLWGPFRKVTALHSAVQVLAEVSGVRDCAIDATGRGALSRPLWFADAPMPANATRHRSPACFRGSLGSCCAPCIGQGTGADYFSAVQRARAFLEQGDDSLRAVASQRMLEASEALHFERAAIWRDKVAQLDWLRTRLTHFQASMDRLSFRYNVPAANGEDPATGRVYLIRRGTVRAEFAWPLDAAAEAPIDTVARTLFHHPDPKDIDIPNHDLDEFYLVASWFRRHPEEREHTTRYPTLPG